MSEINQLKRVDKGSDTTYQFFYMLSFVLVFLAYFLKRYPFSPEVLTGLGAFAILSAFIIYVWDGLRQGWYLQKVVGGLFALAFLIILPSRVYLETSILDLSLIAFFLLSVSLDKTDDQLITKLFYLKLMGAVLVLLAYNAHIIPDMTMFRSAKNVVRHSYGFFHPNSFGMYMISLIFDFSLMKKKWQFTNALPLFFLALLTFAITDSRTTFLTSCFIILCYALKPILEKIRVSYKLIVPVVLAFFILGLGLPYIYKGDSPLFLQLDHWFSGRLHIGHAYLERFAWNWLPRDIALVNDFDGRIYYNDSFYLDALLHQGLLLFLLYPTMLIIELWKKRLTLFHTLLFLITFFICTMESYGASIAICSILFLPYFTHEEENELTLLTF